MKNGQPKKILIVDDDAEARTIVRRVLKKLENAVFFEAKDGFEAIMVAEREHPCIVLLDILMPGMDGYETCRRIKSDPLTRHAIVIFMTAVTMEEIDDRIIQAGGDDLLRKPLNTSELFFRVKSYLSLSNHNGEHGSSPNGSEGCLEYDHIDLGNGFYYMIASKSLCRDDHYIPLMKQEILLLEALIRHRNRVVSYDELLLMIAKNEESTIGNLRTLIKLLRQKTYKELIRTLPSIGYQLTFG